MTSSDDRALDTLAIRGGSMRSGFRETSEAVYLTSGFVYDSAEQAQRAFKNEEDAFIYSRYDNPTVAMFEERMRLIEGAEACRGTSSGMAAVNASLTGWLKAGDRVVAGRALFGSCQYILADILPRFGVETVFVDGADLDQWAEALAPGATATFLESPSNPMLDLCDIAAVAELSHKAGAKLIVDNVFATPVYQKPLELGADIVVYSTTKHIDGQGRCLGGAILGTDEFINKTLLPFLRHTGPALSPFNAWVMLKGLETVRLRVEAASATALRLARFLETHPAVKRVRHPGLESHPQHELAKRQMRGFSNLVALELEGGQEAAFRFLNALELVDISNNLGDSKSLATHPSTTTHQRLTEEDRQALGITPGCVRISVGLEDAGDLERDLSQALL